MAKRILCIVADPDTRTDSFSSSVTRAFLDELRARRTDCEITEINLYETPLPYLSIDLIEKMELTTEEESGQAVQQQLEETESLNRLLDQFARTDAFVVISRTIGFGIPARLKSLLEVLAVTKQLEKLNNKKGIHLQIEDDMFTPIFPRDGQDAFRGFLGKCSVNMMETLTLDHRYPISRERESLLLELIEETRETAQEFASFID